MTLEELRAYLGRGVTLVVRWSEPAKPAYLPFVIEPMLESEPAYLAGGRILSGTEGMEDKLRIVGLNIISRSEVETTVQLMPDEEIYKNASIKEYWKTRGDMDLKLQHINNSLTASRNYLASAEEMLEKMKSRLRIAQVFITVAAIVQVIGFAASWMRQ